MCPECGESSHSGPGIPDRFRIFTEGKERGWCRRCGYFSFADADNHQPLSDQQREKMESERRYLAAKEAKRIERKIGDLQKQAYFQGYHDAMSDSHRGYWRNEGIADSLQDLHSLGYVENKEFWADMEQFTSPALSIPYFKLGGDVVNLQYKVLQPTRPGDKYRFAPGLPAPLYLTDRDNEVKGKVLLVEGAKKAIIVHAWMCDKFDAVVGLPGSYPSKECLDGLASAKEVIYACDPDVNGSPAMIHTCHHLASQGVELRVAQLTDKPDDLFVKYGMRPADFNRILNLSRRFTLAS